LPANREFPLLEAAKMNAPNSLLDLRETAPRDRHPLVFRTFDALAPGSGFVLVNDHDPRPLLYTFQHERGDRFEWSVLEAGPEVWRILIHRRAESETPRSVSGYLAWDHDRLDALLASARTDLQAGEADGARRAFGEFRTGLLRHIRIEEAVLFPAFERSTGMGEGGPTSVMRMEHRRIEGVLEEMRQLFDTPEPGVAPFERLRADLLAVLADHNLKEEHIVYPMTDRSHPAAQIGALIREMQAV
jgi:uncharacterized protein (DUF2249 family)/hemerythrin superfamily protein